MEALLTSADPAAAAAALPQPSPRPQFPPPQDMSHMHLNADQQPFADLMLSDARGLHFLSGGPGCGKTFTIAYLIHSLNNAHIPCLPCATTRAAATRIGLGATTLHSSFSIPARNAYLSPLPVESPVYDRLRKARVIIIDEVSMLSPKTLGFVMYRLAQAHGLLHDIPLLLEQVLILLVGDHAQLPAICHHTMAADTPAWLAVLDDVIEEVPAERPASGRGATRKQSTALNYKGMTPAQIAACGGNKKLMDELFALAIASAEAFRTEHKADIMTGQCRALLEEHSGLTKEKLDTMTQSEGYTECSAIWKIKVVDLWELMVNHNFKMDDMARLKNVARNQGDLFMERMRNVKRKRSDNEDATQEQAAALRPRDQPEPSVPSTTEAAEEQALRPRAQMHYVYCITNVNNERTYIGQTVNMKRRYGQHRRSPPRRMIHDAQRDTPFIDNFKMSMLSESDSKHAANESEYYWIQQYETRSSRGYNIAKQDPAHTNQFWALRRLGAI
ncbi:hypothetical protein ABBQ38_011207 [Trebouxia sp. C0009 RCD-2024]